MRQAFRKLSKQLHPDTTSLPNDEATRQFQTVCEAYDLLSDPVQRANYDVSIKNEDYLMNQENQLNLINKNSVQFSKSIGVRRPFSGGELFSLLLLITSIFLSLALGLIVAVLRGENLIFLPSWIS